MAPNSKPRYSVRFPLWIIAISLLFIAICLIIRTLQTQGERDELEASSRTAESKGLTVRKSDQSLEARTARRRTTSSAGAIVESEAATVDGESSTSEELLTISSTPDSASPISGGFAPVALATNATGEIVGRVTLHGKPPPETRIDLSQEPFCAHLHPEGLTTRLWTVSSNGGLADALVLISDPAIRTPASTNLVTIQFTNCQIEPYVSTATAGQALRFQNADRVTHVVRVTGGGLAANLKVIVEPGSNSRSLVSPGPAGLITVQCLLHPWESAYIHLLRHSYAAVTDENGDFRISSVPPGKYSIGVAHGWTTNFIKLPVSVSAGQITAANVTLEAPRH